MEPFGLVQDLLLCRSFTEVLNSDGSVAQPKCCALNLSPGTSRTAQSEAKRYKRETYKYIQHKCRVTCHSEQWLKSLRGGVLADTFLFGPAGIHGALLYDEPHFHYRKVTANLQLRKDSSLASNFFIPQIGVKPYEI